jgi:dTDP-4-amino-4,6-dideoxygalactose transaminase
MFIGRDLPPTGHPIALAPPDTSPLQWPERYRAILVNSGTAALGLALLASRLRHPEIAAPEVVLPGYGCPDLVAAARFAGVRAVLADIGATDPGYDIESLRQVLGENTVAVVAVNFLGIAERLSELRSLLRDRPQIALVEDNAQWFPERGQSGIRAGSAPTLTPSPPLFPEQVELEGDAVCLSFGRGKPVSLLGGGALLLREGCFAGLPAAALNDAIGTAQPGSLFAAKVRIYNLLSHPRLYAAINRNPLLRLGQTVFKPLAATTALDEKRQALLRTNIGCYLARPRRAAFWLHAGLPPASDLPAQLAERSARLLRYPILCRDRAQRDALLAHLRHEGLGATALYQRIMPEVEGVGDQVEVRVALEGARAFADRLLTLPVHVGVTESDVARMLEIVRG